MLKQQFLREAHGVATLKHPHVVAVHQVFEENNTAYMVLDYVAGMDLISLLEDEPERLTGDFLERTLRETLKAIRHIHANGILHRDIAPDNVRVDAADRITLIDFGAASARSAEAQSDDGSVPAVKDGYSPPEFYCAGQAHDFSSDLYSVAATFYHLLTGAPPPDGLSRAEAVAAGEPDPYVSLAESNWDCGYHVLVTLDLALQLARDLRPQSADLWLQSLDDLPKVRPAPVKVPVFDPALETTISTMVRDVNASIPMLLTRRLSRLFDHTPKDPAPKKKQWVDITGTPIFDIETWFRQQEATPRSGRARNMTPDDNLNFDADLMDAPDHGQHAPAEHALPQRKSLIAGLLSRCFSRSPATCAT